MEVHWKLVVGAVVLILVLVVLCFKLWTAGGQETTGKKAKKPAKKAGEGDDGDGDGEDRDDPFI